MTTNCSIRSSLLAPCGMNCAVCIGHLREKKQCPGCRGDDDQRPAHCVQCGIRNCEKLKSKFCFTCDTFPCSRLKQLDRRYRAKYRMSMLENLENLKKSGIRRFAQQETKRWTCPACGGIICVHSGRCMVCGKILT